MPLFMFFFVMANSSSFSAMRRSISCLTWVSSSWHLSIHASADFVNLVDGAASLADLVHDVLDLVAQSLVLPADLPLCVCRFCQS